MPRLRASAPTHPVAGLTASPGSPLPLDLRSGQNRFGTPQAVISAACEALQAPRPEALAAEARHAVAERFGVTPSQVLLGAGANALVWSLARALVEPGSAWLSVEPSVTSFGLAARAAGARVTQWRAVERRGFQLELEQLAELMRVVQPKVVSLSAPADPSGVCVRLTEVFQLAGEFSSTHFVIDQSWLSLSSDAADLERRPPVNVSCVRSLSVELALVGLRAGYALCSAELAEHSQQLQPPMAASAPAAAAIRAALQQQAFIDRCRSQLQSDLAELHALLDALELTHTASVAPFALVRVARASEVAQELLAEHGIAVYDATPVGLPDHLRIAAPAPEARASLRAALKLVSARRGLLRGRERP